MPYFSFFVILTAFNRQLLSSRSGCDSTIEISITVVCQGVGGHVTVSKLRAGC